MNPTADAGIGLINNENNLANIEKFSKEDAQENIGENIPNVEDENKIELDEEAARGHATLG